ncbi:anti-anti-sigma regulatory factor [Rhizomicrobium palustre]|uniref:Anti-anti-sigma regulatory factor n=1 Tax=Rhizomicrobium palustre TaxID=189966 RepID=A0A846N136_9PROT|nr:STAS domain-containing protein [Rhizomicrobium palustre]NIK89638.1 anti-anti-sigma regulatory factor [Rhizomicrobium palustre]
MTDGTKTIADAGVLKITGPGDIREIAALHGRLNDALAQHHSLVLDLDGLENPDITFVQLIEAGRRQAICTGKSLSLSHRANGELETLLERGGFLTEISSRSFWLMENTP